jgi:hypothetical protein
MILNELRIMFSWCIWKGIEKHTKLYDAYVYDSMIIMSMRCDEHEHGIKSLTLNIRPRLKDILAKQV